MESYVNLKKLSDKNSEMEFSAEIGLDTIAEHEKQELAHMGRDFALPGFRKGKVPEEMLRERIHPAELLEEAAESALRVAVRDIMKAENLAVIGMPKITIEKIEPQKPIEFAVRFAIEPIVELPDYKKIGHGIFARNNDVNITEKEIDEALLEIRRIAARATAGVIANNANLGGNNANMRNESEEIPEKPKEIKDADLPELTDDFAQKFGGFKTVAELKEEVKKELVRGKEDAIRNNKRDEIIKTIVEKAKITVPELLVEQELDHFIEARDQELERLGLTLEEYLKQIKKSEKDLAKEERAAIMERVKTTLVFQKIQEAEDITADEREIAANVAFLKRRYPNEDPKNFRRSAASAIIQEKIFKLFEPEPAPIKEKTKEE